VARIFRWRGPKRNSSQLSVLSSQRVARIFR
jgi:hypothetical protein